MTVDDSSSSPSFRELDDVFLQIYQEAWSSVAFRILIHLRSQARIWLGEVLHMRFDEQLSICDLLSDGELLFEVSKALWNLLLVKYMELKNIKAHMFIPVDTRKSSGRYRPYSNVDSFLKVCKVLGLSGVDLFSPSDVVEKRDTRKVCICIRSLSKKARSKQLNVPDFDIVTKTVAMPTDVVRCIRRSLELSTSSSTHGQSKHARLIIRQKRSSASQKQEEESCLEEPDDAKSNILDTTYADFMYLESGESSMTFDKYALTHGTQQPSAGSQEIDRFAHIAGSAEESLLFQYASSDNQSEGISSPACESRLIIRNEFTPMSHGAKNWHDNGENALSQQNMGEIDHLISLSDMISNRIFTSLPFHIYEDCLCHSCMHGESHNSNTTPNTSIGRTHKKFPDDVEASSTTTVSSVVGRVLDFDIDFHANAEPGDLRTSVSITPDLQQLGARRLCKVSASCNQFLESPFETEFSSRCWNDPKSYCTMDQDFELLNQISQAQKDFEHSLMLVKDNVTIVADSTQEAMVDKGENDKLMKGVKMADLKLTCKVNDMCNDHVTVESSERCYWIIQDQSGKGFCNVKEDDQECTNQSDDVHCYAEDRTKVASQDEIRDYGIDCLVEANTNERNNKRMEKKPTYVAPLLKTVAKGTALIGIILLLHFSNRKRSDGNTNNKSSEKSSQINWKSSGVGFSRRKGETGSKIYPVEKFKFED